MSATHIRLALCAYTQTHTHRQTQIITSTDMVNSLSAHFSAVHTCCARAYVEVYLDRRQAIVAAAVVGMFHVLYDAIARHVCTTINWF